MDKLISGILRAGLLHAGAIAMVMMGAGSAFASNPSDLRDIAERVEQLEYQAQSNGFPVPPLPIPTISTSSPNAGNQGRIEVAQSAASLAVRVDRLETQMRQQTGQMEEMSFRIRQLQEQLRRFQEDSEFRFQDLERGKGKKRRKSSSVTPKQPKPQTFDQLGKPPTSLGSLSQNQLNSGQAGLPAAGGAGPIDLSSMLGGGTGAASGAGGVGTPGVGGSQVANLTGDPASDYDAAYGLVLQGDYVNSEKAFRRFVAAYKQDRLVPNALYWIGESLYQQGNYRGAIEIFLSAYSDHPNGQKSPDLLLKTGMSLRKINERDAACATYEELLAKFPKASSGVRQRVLAEIKSAKC